MTSCEFDKLETLLLADELLEEQNVKLPSTPISRNDISYSISRSAKEMTAQSTPSPEGPRMGRDILLILVTAFTIWALFKDRA